MQKHLSILSSNQYRNLPVNPNYQLVECYLAQTHNVMSKAFAQHPRSIVFHAELRFPKSYQCSMADNECLSRFIASFKEQVCAELKTRAKSGCRVHKTAVRYVWCREQSSSKNVHYHVFFLMNGDSFRNYGDLSNPMRGQLCYMLNIAWCRALHIEQNPCSGLVHFPGPIMRININELNPTKSYDEFMKVDATPLESVAHWISYLSKIDTKQYGQGRRSFGCSQK
ncbi:inovirus Gp2 family protein [Marinomonas flavescens]|uniref:inovirus Gp2 family protein n=1 Tax=Marinomonas flavescens TaxID=2529379 RepID=UPI0010559A2F|nr:inovirus Gp2 family protein [Marinomonas flavescens]